MKTHPRRSVAFARSALAAAASALLATFAVHAAGAPDPGDYAPAPPGTTALAIYAQQMRGDKVYDGGHRVADGLGLKMDLGILRGMHYFQIAGMPADVEIVLPMARQRISSVDYRESGIGNLTLGATIWPYSDETSGRHWGIASYLSTPTGQKRDQGLAVSENRWAWDIETGYIMKLAPQWSLDLVGQLEFYSNDKTTEFKRKPMLRGFAHLSYLYSEQTRLAFSVRQTLGMKETLGQATMLGARQDTNLMLTWQQWLSESTQVQVQYQHDVRVRNGTPVHGMQLRLVQVF